jgi:hypothetical protein
LGELLPNLGLLGSTVKAVTTLPSVVFFKKIREIQVNKTNGPSYACIDLLETANGVVTLPQVC